MGNCLDAAVESNHEDVVKSLINSRYFTNLLSNGVTVRGKPMTPLRRMIKKMPGVAKLVFDKCIENNDGKYTFDFTFIDDNYTLKKFHISDKREDTKNEYAASDDLKENSDSVTTAGLITNSDN